MRSSHDARGVGVGVDEDVPVIERGEQPDVLGQQHSVAEHVAAHVTDADDGEVLGLGVHAHLAEVALDGLPRTLGGDAHRLVVVARPIRRTRTRRRARTRMTRDVVGDVGERRGALVGGHHEVSVVTVAAHHIGRGDDVAGGLVDVVGEVEQPGDEQLVAGHALVAVRVAVGGGITGGRGGVLDDEAALGADRAR